MPAFVNSSVSSCGIRLDDGTGVWPRAAKNSRKAARSSSAVRGGGTGQIVPPAPASRSGVGGSSAVPACLELVGRLGRIDEPRPFRAQLLLAGPGRLATLGERGRRLFA